MAVARGRVLSIWLHGFCGFVHVERQRVWVGVRKRFCLDFFLSGAVAGGRLGWVCLLGVSGLSEC